MIITYRDLRRAGACSLQRQLFLKAFSRKGGRVTLARCLRYAQRFRWTWAAANLFSEGQCGHFQAARNRADDIHRRLYLPDATDTAARADRAYRAYNIRLARAFYRASLVK
jgi:hypothetical protein